MRRLSTINDDDSVTARRRDVMVISTEPSRATNGSVKSHHATLLRQTWCSLAASALTASPRHSSRYEATCVQLMRQTDLVMRERTLSVYGVRE